MHLVWLIQSSASEELCSFLLSEGVRLADSEGILFRMKIVKYPVLLEAMCCFVPVNALKIYPHKSPSSLSPGSHFLLERTDKNHFCCFSQVEGPDWERSFSLTAVWERVLYRYFTACKHCGCFPDGEREPRVETLLTWHYGYNFMWTWGVSRLRFLWHSLDSISIPWRSPLFIFKCSLK